MVPGQNEMETEMTKTNEKKAQFAELISQIQSLSDTSKKIRHAASQCPAEGEASPIAFAYKMLKLAGVTTKNGDEIRYQHVRNVMLTKLTSK